MAGQIASTSSDDALMEDDYAGPPKARKGKASGKKSKKGPPKKAAKKGKAGAKKAPRQFAPAQPAQPSRIAQAMGAPC